MRVIEGSPEKITCAVDIMEFAIGSTAREARSTSSSVNWKLLPLSTCGLLPNCMFIWLFVPIIHMDQKRKKNQITDEPYLWGTESLKNAKPNIITPRWQKVEIGLPIITQRSLQEYSDETCRMSGISGKRVWNFTCLKVISLENEHEKNMDPNPNHNADLATFLHITSSTILSQRPSHPDCSTKSDPLCQKRNGYCGMFSKFEIDTNNHRDRENIQNSKQ